MAVMHVHSGAHRPARVPALEWLGVHSETQTLRTPRVPKGECPGWEALKGCSRVDFVRGRSCEAGLHTEYSTGC